jgi:hypothetical protein
MEPSPSREALKALVCIIRENITIIIIIVVCKRVGK